MGELSSRDITGLLHAWGRGNNEALQKLVPMVYEDLHAAARRYMAHERPGHTLQTTALIHETYLRLVDVRKVKWQNRAHFFAMCAQLMRRILIDFARSRSYKKRGGAVPRVDFDEALLVTSQPEAALEGTFLGPGIRFLDEISCLREKGVSSTAGNC